MPVVFAVSEYEVTFHEQAACYAAVMLVCKAALCVKSPEWLEFYGRSEQRQHDHGRYLHYYCTGTGANDITVVVWVPGQHLFGLIGPHPVLARLTRSGLPELWYLLEAKPGNRVAYVKHAVLLTNPSPNLNRELNECADSSELCDIVARERERQS